jgi:hypothetical protein
MERGDAGADVGGVRSETARAAIEEGSGPSCLGRLIGAGCREHDTASTAAPASGRAPTPAAVTMPSAASTAASSSPVHAFHRCRRSVASRAR